MKTNWTSTVITLHSVSGVWLQFHVICSKYYKLYYPTFLLLKICFPYTYYEDIKPFKVKGGARFLATWFPRKDWGEFQAREELSWLNTKSGHCCVSWDGRWPVRNNVMFEVNLVPRSSTVIRKEDLVKFDFEHAQCQRGPKYWLSYHCACSYSLLWF